MRHPLGRQYQPDAAFRDLTRPAVLKATGVVIQPLRYSKPVEAYSGSKAAKARGVVTVAGGMAMPGKAGGASALPKLAAPGGGKKAAPPPAAAKQRGGKGASR
jgi:hypothetical protein